MASRHRMQVDSPLIPRQEARATTRRERSSEAAAAAGGATEAAVASDIAASRHRLDSPDSLVSCLACRPQTTTSDTTQTEARLWTSAPLDAVSSNSLACACPD